jgi:hypothetical protein
MIYGITPSVKDGLNGLTLAMLETVY